MNVGKKKVINGLWEEWDSNGQQTVKGLYSDGFKNGLWEEWSTTFLSQPVYRKGIYINDVKDGKWVEIYNYNAPDKAYQKEYHYTEENTIITNVNPKTIIRRKARESVETAK